MEAEDILRSLGVEHVEIAGNLAEAGVLIEAQPFDFALLDVNLGSQTSFDFAALLAARGMPFGFVSGYGENSFFPAALRKIPHITKPFDESSMARLLAAATAGQP
ncbi:regulator [Pararhizobium polonicum]|uniref:Regulator n=2 Tax=Pararhizobium polonicum TaxID=1612624 RepID=A0A1C7NUH0_9HYPH|nr:regulator [Pararhizobium polonicum]